MLLVRRVLYINRRLIVNGSVKLASIASRHYCEMSTATNKLQAQMEREYFIDVWPGLLNSIVQNHKLAQEPEIANWVKKTLEYNTNGGKLIRGMTTVYAYRNVEKPENITDESLKLARVLGWCVEMLQAFLIVQDDVMDGASTRRGVPCWYKLPDVGMEAIADAVFLLNSMYQALKIYFSDHPCYLRMVENFNDALLFTGMGQYLDYTTAQSNKNFALFTIERYEKIITYKSAYYTFQLPVSVGLLLANITNEEVHRQVDDMCLQLGKLFQMQDDFIDCYGEESKTGKASTDIREGKCTWFAVQALHRLNDRQKIVFKACYGSNEPAHIERIQRLYEQLRLKEVFYEQEKEIYDNIVNKSKVLETSTGVPAKLILTLLDMLDKRRQ